MWQVIVYNQIIATCDTFDEAVKVYGKYPVNSGYILCLVPDDKINNIQYWLNP